VWHASSRSALSYILKWGVDAWHFEQNIPKIQEAVPIYRVLRARMHRPRHMSHFLSKLS